MNSGKKILVVTPSFPLVESGAEQMERAEGLRQMVRLGHEVVVIAKVVPWMNVRDIEAKAKEWGVRVRTVPYYFSNRSLSFTERLQKFFGKFRHPLYFDGAAYEFAEPLIQAVFKEELKTFKPELVWFEYTYLWPLYSLAKKAGLPIITRSQNFEPEHFLEENGRTLLNYLRYIPKYLGEKKMISMSDLVLAITPNEATHYRAMGAREVEVLPLRALPHYVNLPRPIIKTATPLHVFFMGSSFNVEHNRAAAETVILHIAPHSSASAPGAFVFHIFGSKLPQQLKERCDGREVIYEGYVDTLDATLARMDIALVPSLMGAGMQQKVFEPLARGIPTITSPRAIAGYDFKEGREYLGGESVEAFTSALLAMRDQALKETLSKNASNKSRELFSQQVLDRIIQTALQTV